MDFPAHVPAAVREKLSHYLDSSNGEKGYIDLLKSAESDLAELVRAIEVRIQRGEVEYLPDLNKKKAEATEYRDMIAGDVACLQRLAHDSRMRDAYALLTREFSADEQWAGFTFSAWAARVNFGKYRERVKRARELKAEIVDAAVNLASLLHRFSATGLCGPDEFYSVPELLRQTDNRDIQSSNFEMWRAMRPHVLGDLTRAQQAAQNATRATRTEAEKAPKFVVHFGPGGETEADPKQQERDLLRYAWQLAPDLPAILQTVATAARNFQPSETGMIGAAIDTRQRSPKTEYVRAFANRLTESYGLTLTTGIRKAMAVTANVVIDLPDVDVSDDDVRKALLKLVDDPSENSKGK